MSKYKTPCRKIPDELLHEYTMDGEIPVLNWYLAQNYPRFLNWSNELIQAYVNDNTPDNIRNNKGQSPYGKRACIDILDACVKYDIQNKNIAIIGSITPWLESLLLNLGNHVTTVEYHVPTTKYKNLVCISCENFKKSNQVYDCIISYSTIQHCGLGCYGEPLNPNGDIEEMSNIRNHLTENGLFLWSCPVGKDVLAWNAQRIYGPIRLPVLFEGFVEKEWFGRTKIDCFNSPLAIYQKHMPLVVLQKVL